MILETYIDQKEPAATVPKLLASARIWEVRLDEFEFRRAPICNRSLPMSRRTCVSCGGSDYFLYTYATQIVISSHTTSFITSLQLET